MVKTFIVQNTITDCNAQKWTNLNLIGWNISFCEWLPLHTMKKARLSSIPVPTDKDFD